MTTLTPVELNWLRVRGPSLGYRTTHSQCAAVLQTCATHPNGICVSIVADGQAAAVGKSRRSTGLRRRSKLLRLTHCVVSL